MIRRSFRVRQASCLITHSFEYVFPSDAQTWSNSMLHTSPQRQIGLRSLSKWHTCGEAHEMSSHGSKIQNKKSNYLSSKHILSTSCQFQEGFQIFWLTFGWNINNPFNNLFPKSIAHLCLPSQPYAKSWDRLFPLDSYSARFKVNKMVAKSRLN